MGSNKQVVDRMFSELINAGKLELVDELFAPAFVSHTAQGDMDRTAFREFVRGWRTGFPDLHCEVSQLIEDGERVSWTVRATGTQRAEFNGIPATGKAVDFLSMNHAIVRNGQGVEHWVVFDMLTMLTQLGVVPAPAAAG